MVPPAGATATYWDPVRRQLRAGPSTLVFERSRLVSDVRIDAIRLVEFLPAGGGEVLVVGAGVGGLLARMAAATAEAHVSRLLLDSTSEWFTENPALPECVRASLRSELDDNAEGRRLRHLLDDLRNTPELGAPGDARCFVVARGVPDWPVDDAFLRRVMHQAWVDCQRQFAASARSAVFMLAEGCGHHIARDDPRFVAQLISSALS
jgi:pimeloyl-ACP methyl ester carboxylesterase